MEGKIKPKMVFILIIIVLCLVILIQNTHVVTVRLFFWKISISQIIFMPLILLVGFIIGFFISRWLIRKRSH